MDNNTKEKTIEFITKLVLFFLVVAIIALPIWLFTIFGSIVFSILVFAVEVVVSLCLILGAIN